MYDSPSNISFAVLRDVRSPLRRADLENLLAMRDQKSRGLVGFLILAGVMVLGIWAAYQFAGSSSSTVAAGSTVIPRIVIANEKYPDRSAIITKNSNALSAQHAVNASRNRLKVGVMGDEGRPSNLRIKEKQQTALPHSGDAAL